MAVLTCVAIDCRGSLMPVERIVRCFYFSSKSLFCCSLSMYSYICWIVELISYERCSLMYSFALAAPRSDLAKKAASSNSSDVYTSLCTKKTAAFMIVACLSTTMGLLTMMGCGDPCAE